MRDAIAQLLDDLRDGKTSRRQFLQALAAAVAVPAVSLAQAAGGGRGAVADSGRGGGRGGRGLAPRDTTPLVLPFEPTGWNTVWLDHLSYQCVDYKKAAAFYATLMGWKVRSDDGRQCVLDIGENSGGIIIRGGLMRRRRPRSPTPGLASIGRPSKPCSTASPGASRHGTRTK